MEHGFNVELATAYGVDEAVMIRSLQHWIMLNKAKNDRRGHYREGRWWTYNSFNALAELFPYWTARQIRRIMKNLLDNGVIISAQHGLAEGDQSNWWAFADEARFLALPTPRKEDRDQTVTVLIETGGPCPNGHGIASGDHDQTVKDHDRTVILSKDQLGTSYMSSPPPPTPVPGQAPVPAMSEAELELEGVRLYNETANDWYRYFRMPINIKLASRIANVLGYFISIGKRPNPSQISIAVDRAIASWNAKGIAGSPRDPEPVLNELSALVNPLPAPEKKSNATNAGPVHHRAAHRNGGAEQHWPEGHPSRPTGGHDERAAVAQERLRKLLDAQTELENL